MHPGAHITHKPTDENFVFHSDGELVTPKPLNDGSLCDVHFTRMGYHVVPANGELTGPAAGQQGIVWKRGVMLHTDEAFAGGPICIYYAQKDGSIHVRPYDQMHDGRFMFRSIELPTEGGNYGPVVNPPGS